MNSVRPIREKNSEFGAVLGMQYFAECLNPQRVNCPGVRVRRQKYGPIAIQRVVGLLITVFALHSYRFSFAYGFLSKQPSSRRQQPCSQEKLRMEREIQVTGRSRIESQSVIRQTICDSIKGEERNDPMEKFGLYVYNLQRHRKKKNTKTAKSLSYYLRENPIIYPHYPEQIIEVFERALIQAIRTAGEAGDYKLILELISGSIIFANGNPILPPRIFGEALDALSQTGANVSKLKYVWNLVANGAGFLQNPLTAFELNIMLKSVASRGRYRSCVDIYHQHTFQHGKSTYIQPDAYTGSTLFCLLTESISTQQKPVEVVDIQPTCASSSLQSKLIELSNSPCWQWNTAVELLHTLGDETVHWNNHAYSSLMKLQDKAQESFEDHQNGSRIALAILNSMRTHGTIPDVVTCTLAIKALGDSASSSMSWKLAVRFLDQMMVDEQLPAPNAYSYSAAIVACARSQQYSVALGLLDQMRAPSNYRKGSNVNAAVAPEPNTWVYNAALLAISSPEHQRGRQARENDKQSGESRRGVALKLLEQMKMDCIQEGFDTRPDTVTYNTILALLATTRVPSNNVIVSLMDQMTKEKVPRDAITYHNAVLASKGDSDIIRLLCICLQDNLSRSRSPATLEGKAAFGLTFVFNTALSVFASGGNLKLFGEAFSLMQENNIPCDRETMSHLVTIIGKSGNSDILIPLLGALEQDDGSTFWEKEFVQRTGLLLSRSALPPLHVSHFSGAISCCLTENELDHAHAILSIMRDSGMVPNSDVMENFAAAYARAAIKSVAKEKKQVPRGFPPNEQSISAKRVKSSFDIAMTLSKPSPSVLSVVAKACARTGQWQHARKILRTLQEGIVSNHANDERYQRSSIDTLSDLQSGLLEECAKQGNITTALWYVNDIQRFSYKFVKAQQAVNRTLFSDGRNLESDFLGFLEDVPLDCRVIVGMKVRDWVSVVKAARKSGHWRVCYNTLQILRPYVERTNPSVAKDGNDRKLESRYKQLATSLIHATACLEQESKYAWAVRAITDWTSWSGRRVPPEAVLSVIRVLCARGRGQEVKDLLFRCAHEGRPVRGRGKMQDSYEQMLYIGAVTSLHRYGLYDDADEIYVSGVSEGYLPLLFENQGDQVVLDLHGLNVAMAHSAVRIAMRQQTAIFNERSTSDMTIITGRGRNSALHLRPVLRPEVQRMLVEEFYPPLNTVSVPGNMGAVVVSASDITRWQEHQEEQKGAQMMAVAAVLKDLSTNRLRQSIALTFAANEEDADS